MIERSCFDRKRDVRIPPIVDEKVAEFLGILTGDGSVSRHKCGRRSQYDVCIAGHLTEDFQYLTTYVKPLLYSLFNINPSVHAQKNKNTYRVIIRSKAVVSYLEELGFPIGPKDKITSPNCINNKKLTYAFLRGVADTDFSLCFKSRKKKKNYYPAITASFRGIELVEDLKERFTSLGFSPAILVNSIMEDKRGFRWKRSYINLNGNRNLKLWMKKIGFKNFKHMSKYLIWKEFGYCPPYTTLDERIKILNGTGVI